MWSGRVSRFCSTSSTRHVTPVTNSVISHEWGKNGFWLRETKHLFYSCMNACLRTCVCNFSLFFFASRSSEICFDVIARSFLNRTENRSDDIYKKWERKRKNIGHANAIKIYIFVKMHPICLYESSCLIVCFPMLPWFLWTAHSWSVFFNIRLVLY